MGLLRFRSSGEASKPADPIQQQGAGPLSGRDRFTAGLFIIAAFAALYAARSFFMPAALSLLFALLLAPAVHFLARRRIPAALGSIVVLICFLGLLSLAGYLLSGPVSLWVRKGPEAFARLSARAEPIIRPFHKMKTAFQSAAPAAAEEPAQKLEVKQPGIMAATVSRTGAFVSIAGTAFILLYFLLASGDALLGSIVGAISSVDRRVRLLSIVQDIKHHISRYLLAITSINLAEGALIALGTSLAGMPTPLLWGALHALLNFIPYLGAITGLAITTLAALTTFDSVSRIMIPPAIYVAVMVLDNFAGPLVLGKRLVLNPALVFLSLMLWGFLWGIVGILIAVPTLIIAKIICDHVPELNRYSRIISADKPG